MNYSMDIGNNRLSNILKLRKLKDWGRGKLNDWRHTPPKIVQFLDNIVYPKIKNLETLYLNDNDFKELPKEIKNIKDLKYLDFRNNKYTPKNFNQMLDNYGIIIKF